MKIVDLIDVLEISDKNYNIEIKITKRNYSKNISYFNIKQIHSDRFLFINQNIQLQHNFEGDAIITNQKNFPIGVRTADCLPIFLYTRDFISVIHAGWRGTAKRITEKVIKYLLKNLNILVSDIKIVFGIAICKDCYKIGDDMKIQFLNEFGEIGEKFFYNNFFDLKEANRHLLKDMGIKDSQILNLNKCTICDNKEYFSYRKERTTKRINNIIISKSGG